MITVEQIEQLNIKVRRAVGLIEELKDENHRYKLELERLQARMDQMQVIIDENQRNTTTLNDSNNALSRGIIGAIEQLSIVDDSAPFSVSNSNINQENNIVSYTNETLANDTTSNETLALEVEEEFSLNKNAETVENKDHYDYSYDISTNNPNEETANLEEENNQSNLFASDNSNSSSNLEKEEDKNKDMDIF